MMLEACNETFTAKMNIAREIFSHPTLRRSFTVSIHSQRKYFRLVGKKTERKYPRRLRADDKTLPEKHDETSQKLFAA